MKILTFPLQLMQKCMSTKKFWVDYPSLSQTCKTLNKSFKSKVKDLRLLGTAAVFPKFQLFPKFLFLNYHWKVVSNLPATMQATAHVKTVKTLIACKILIRVIQCWPTDNQILCTSSHLSLYLTVRVGVTNQTLYEAKVIMHRLSLL